MRMALLERPRRSTALGNSELRGLRAEIEALEERFNKRLRKLYPVGAELTWERAGRIYCGKVVDHTGTAISTNYDRLRVENDGTGKQYWITAFDILRAAARHCRGCGCTDDQACPGGCSWVEDDLCSACAPRPRRKQRQREMST
jgi:hypothetical protein